MPKRTLASSGRRVVITGAGCISPLGNNLESTWGALLEGRSGAGPITQFDSSKIDVHFACEVKGFDPETYINKKELRRMDRFIQLGISAAAQALEQSKLSVENVSADRIGVIVSSGMGGLPMIEEQHMVAIEKPHRVSPFFIPAVIPNMISGYISIQRGFRGPNYCLVSACASSTHSIGEAVRLIERGDVDAMVAGGAEATICVMGMAGFASMKALSTRNEAPEKASRPFDKDRDGFVMGEGASVLVLESLESAEKRGANILGEIVGYGLNSDAYHITSPSEGGEGAANCMRLALEDAGLRPEQIAHINMHGTSTPNGDVAESSAIETVFGEHAKKLLCNSTKSMTGHLLGSAGSLEALITMMALQKGIVPPTINLENQDENCRLNYCANKAQTFSGEYAISNSFGFGGTNGALVLKRFS